ncbi:MAG: galactosyltransferase-related protein [Gammaproteobacteria bacterium]|nr:galactosyltransferase-related protein [Gammaproteobacteria bacterium]
MSIAEIKDYIATLIHDGVAFLYFVYIRKEYKRVHNRKESVTSRNSGNSVQCNWKFSNEIKLCNAVPITAKILLKKSCEEYPFVLKDSLPVRSNDILISVIIGHRGLERIEHLEKTIDSFFGQTFSQFEIIVVESDQVSRLKLREEIQHVFCANKTKEPYNRAQTFNVGARMARGQLLVLHDNDMIVPSTYLQELYDRYCEGYKFINIKRFIFYLSETTSKHYRATSKLDYENFIFESVVQNLEGGGSAAACKDSFFEIGGMDESFVGWGGEDNEFWERASTRSVYSAGSQPIIHIWHPSQKEKKERDTASGVKRYFDLQKVDAFTRIENLKRSKSG